MNKLIEAYINIKNLPLLSEGKGDSPYDLFRADIVPLIPRPFASHGILDSVLGGCGQKRCCHSPLHKTSSGASGIGKS